MKRFLKRLFFITLALFVLLAIIIVVRGYFAFRDRIPGYSLSVNIDGANARLEPRPLRVGFARMKINPDVSDPKHPIWLAGFSQHRAASAIHDDLWSIACVIDDGYSRIGFVGIDAIGFFQDDVVKVRRALAAASKFDFITICS